MQFDDGSGSARQTMDADGLRVERVAHGSVVVYRVTGEVDTLTAPHLDLAITDADEDSTGVSHVVLDLTDVPFLSSAGLSILVAQHTRCARDGIGFGVVAVQHAVLRAIEITALDSVIPLYESLPAALRAAN
ncbi:MAG TPA: STAS domain-containing protein [Pseudonocardiaceae bacterium]|nr:STAS domain-containing protein [Pseudonocardiaceae bacterium]